MKKKTIKAGDKIGHLFRMSRSSLTALPYDISVMPDDQRLARLIIITGQQAIGKSLLADQIIAADPVVLGYACRFDFDECGPGYYRQVVSRRLEEHYRRVVITTNGGADTVRMALGAALCRRFGRIIHIHMKACK